MCARIRNVLFHLICAHMIIKYLLKKVTKALYLLKIFRDDDFRREKGLLLTKDGQVITYIKRERENFVV